MKWLNQLGLAAGLAIMLLARPAVMQAQAPAQDMKPVGIVSIASVNENLADIAYVTRAAGMADYGDTARFLVGAMAAGIDKGRPIGLYFVPKQQEFHAVAFVPLEANGLTTIFKVHKDQLGEPTDLGGGLYEVGRGKTVFIKDQGGWGFIAEKREFLSDLPQDPAAILGDLPKKYNVAGKLLIQNIPIELRRMATDQIKIGIERFLESPAARQGNIDREQAQQLSGMYIQQLERLLNEAEELLLGLAIDEQEKRIVLDVGGAAKEGTSLAQSMAMQVDVKTSFAGFLLPDASATLIAATKSGPEEIKQAKAAIAAARGQWSKQIDDSPDIPADKRDALKGILAQVFDLVEKTIETGRTDFGGTILLGPKSVSFAAGGYVADGAAVERILKSVVDITKDLPNAPQIELNSGSQGELRLSRLSAPIPQGNREAREVLGDTLEVLFATGPQTFIVSGGKDAAGLLRKVTAGSAGATGKPVRPIELVVSLLPILRFSQSIQDNPVVNSIVAGLEQSGNDKIAIFNEPGQRTSLTRIEIQEGVVKAIGEGAKAAGARFRPPGR